MQDKGSSKIFKASAVSAFGTGFSRVFGMVRDVAISHVFGAGRISDAFWMAWTVPGLFRRYVADEGLSGAMIPAMAQAGREGGEAQARRFANYAVFALLAACALICAGGILFAPWLVRIIAPGFMDDPEKLDLTITLTRWLFPFVAFVSLVSYCESLLNIRGHFFLPKLAPGIVSGCVAVSVFFLANRFAQPVYSLVVGVLAGGLTHLLVCIPPLIRRWGLPRPSFAGIWEPRFKSFLAEMGKVAVIGLTAQLNVILLRAISSGLEEGAVTQYWYANRLVDFSQGTIAVAVGSALLPAIAQDTANRNWSGFSGNFSEAVRLTALVLIPAACLLIGLAHPVVSILFLHGEFDIDDTLQTAATLQFLAPFMVALGGINIVKKAYFALDDRTTLLKVGGLGLVLTACAGYVLSTRIGVKGLGLALSFSAAVQLVFYIYILRGKIGGVLNLAALLIPLLKLLLSALPAAAAATWVSRYGEWAVGPSSVWNWMILTGSGILGLVIYIGIAWLLRVEELHGLISRLKRPSNEEK